MVVMQRLPFAETQVRELLVEDVPSIRTLVGDASGQEWRLYIVHPEPPVPYHDTKGRDGEIARIWIEVSEDNLPTIVTGDLNDVAWFHDHAAVSTAVGFARPPPGAWILQYFSYGQRLDALAIGSPVSRSRIPMARLRDIGPDLFPILFSLALTQSQAATTAPERSDAAERD